MCPKDDGEKYFVARAKVVLGSGTIIGLGYDAAGAEAAIVGGADGLPADKEAVSTLLRLWVTSGEDPSAVVPLCLLACESGDPALRVLGLDMLGALAARGEALPEFERVENLIRTAMAGPDPAVKAAAAKARRHLG